MKRAYLVKAVAAIAVMSASTAVVGYDYTFANHTPYDLAVKIGLAAWGDKIGPFIIKAGEEYTYKAGERDWRQGGLCINNIWYRKWTPKDTPNAAYYEVAVRWVDKGIKDHAIAMAEGLTDIGIKAGGAALSGGATEGAAAAEGAAKKVSASEVAGKSMQAVPEGSLGKAFGGIGNLIARTGCMNRQYDIFEIEDASGNKRIEFASEG